MKFILLKHFKCIIHFVYCTYNVVQQISSPYSSHLTESSWWLFSNFPLSPVLGNKLLLSIFMNLAISDTSYIWNHEAFVPWPTFFTQHNIFIVIHVVHIAKCASLRLHCIPLYIYTTFFFIQLSMDIYVVSTFWLWWIMMNTYLFEILISVLLDKSEAGLLYLVVVLFKNVWGMSIFFSIIAEIFHIPSNSAQMSQYLYILAKTFCLLFLQ